MADQLSRSPQSGRKSAGRPSREGEAVQCGVIMPISETLNHTEAHWADVLKLIHRAIKNAGYEPKNVWESASTDRISERIVGNIFNLPIAVVDISDLNPNVMFELGLRLSSKKPTVVIANEGQQIPFDIRDFQAIFYPADMNMLAMESFFEKLSEALGNRYSSFLENKYMPFLSTVIIDVASPETREVGLNELIISRLDDITRRINIIDTSRQSELRKNWLNKIDEPIRSSAIDYIIPEDAVDRFIERVVRLPEVSRINHEVPKDGKAEVKVFFRGSTPWNSVLRKTVQEIALSVGGEEDLPF